MDDLKEIINEYYLYKGTAYDTDGGMSFGYLIPRNEKVIREKFIVKKF
jgi:hypothetical protein